MTRRIILISLCIALVLLCAIFFLKSKPTVSLQSADSYPIAKHIRMRYKLTNTSDQVLKDVSVKLYSPVPKNSNQKVQSLSIKESYIPKDDQLGNRVIEFTVEQINPFQSKYLDVRVNLEMAIKPQSHLEFSEQDYLIDSPGITVSNAKIQNLASELKKDTELETLKAYYDWIVGNLQYIGYVKDDLGALYALEQKKGDCTEYAYLMAALARANGIPARVIGGYVYAEDSVVRARDYHNWVEVFVNDKWHIIDPQKERFMENYLEYIAFRILPTTSSELDTSHQVIISDSKVSVSL